MQHIDLYAVMRNTATLEAYRARQRAVVRAAWPFSIVAAVFAAAAWPSFLYIHYARRLFPGESPIITARVGVFVVACLIGFGVCAALAGFRVWRYRRDHPIPQDWLLAHGSRASSRSGSRLRLQQ